ncbi:conserved Plasmodium protein, unknown function [Plasmodium gallinaceum]|uniref:Uncharacterized protein n=1 Tax=Plasmodium gallinaceum TaxID=5849 RepID=A0A1J1GR76_PLAGA|nr:conserved Plasmodium protein, unknown function [Plasmodium gallinaceum]CRG95039.1 conserved Plasmodium protein, unknown function [Plasmodium gallinaceum]
MFLRKTEENKNSNENAVEACISYYEDFIELRKKIILKEKEIIEKRKNNIKIGENQKNKFSYRSFDEFYKCKKNFEEYENKIKNETWKLLNKVNHKNNNSNEEQIKNDEKYSYIKFKTERQGTVKQLKEYFQKIQEEKIQKRNNSLYIKNNVKSTISIKSKDSKEELRKKKETILEKSKNEEKEYILKNNENEEKEYILKNNENEEKEYILKNNENEKKEYILENKEIEKRETETYNNISRSELEKSSINTSQNKNEINEQNKRIENMNSKEIELLYNLINEMKNSYESDEDYISNLIEELHNSNKRYMIDKILDLLKIFDDKVSSNVLNKKLKVNNLHLEKDEKIDNNTNYDGELKEMEEILENKKLNNEMDKLNKKFIKENEDFIKNKEQSKKINHINTKMEHDNINKNKEKEKNIIEEEKKIKNEIYEKIKSEIEDEKIKNEIYEKIKSEIDDEKIKNEIYEKIKSEIEEKKIKNEIYEKIKSEIDDEKIKNDIYEKIKSEIEDEKIKNEILLNNRSMSDSDVTKKHIKEENIYEDKLKNNYKNENFNVLIGKTENNNEKVNKSNQDVYNKNDIPCNQNINSDNKIEKDTNYTSKFEWFYSSMKDIYENVNEYEENSNLNEEVKDYSSDGSENNDLFLWLKNRDVENILNEKNKIKEGDIIEE